jgi:hypothetical protein
MKLLQKTIYSMIYQIAPKICILEEREEQENI